MRQRAAQSPDHVLYTLVNSKGVETVSLTCAQLLRKAERIGLLLLEKGHLNQGDHVALIFPPGIDLITAFYGCLCVGKTFVAHILDSSKTALQETVTEACFRIFFLRNYKMALRERARIRR